MKILLLLAALMAAAAPDYVHPVKVQILEVQSAKGSGHGNVYDPTFGIRGFDYVAGGCWNFGPSLGPDRYPARWQSDQQLVIVLHQVGYSDRVEECTLHVTLRDVVYAAGKDGQLTTKPIPPKK
jgi:hypothetical protein